MTRASGLAGLFVHEERRLSSGLRVLMVPRPQLQRASIALHVRVGSRYETRETNGLSHFLEHMLYRGTPRLPTSHEQALAFERLGGTLYAATATDHGVMNLTVPSETLEPSIELLGDVVRSPIFSALEIEKGIIEEEIREDLDENDRQVDPDNLTRALLFPDHPLGFTITGSVEQLHRHDRAALERHHRRHYGAVNMVASVAGAFDVERTFAALERALGPMAAGETVSPEPAPALPGKPRLLYLDSEGSQTELRVAFRGFGERHAHEPAIELLLRVIDDGMATRLYERLCDTKGLCYDVSSTVESFADDGILDLAAETQHERAPTVVREMLELCRELAEHGPTDAEVDVVRSRLTWASRAMLDDPEDLASFYGLAALSDVTLTPDARCEQLLAVSREQIRDAAAALFRPERLGVVAVGVLGRAAHRELERTVKNFR